MGPLRYISILVMLVLASGSSMVWGQSPFDRSFYPAAFMIREHVEVFTDRSIYVVGESIHFRADHIVEGMEQENLWSSVLYVELITSSGMAVSQEKFALSGGLGSGTLQIPAGSLTGNYYLKCYTRWMRNRGPKIFSYLPLKIINPYNSEVAGHSNGSVSDERITRRVYRSGILECRTQDPAYVRGEMVQFQITGPSNSRLQHLSSCITVVPAGGIDTTHGQVTFPAESLEFEDFSVNYLPDLNGPSLSGRVVKTEQGGDPVQSATIYFSLLGGKPDYFTAVTDDNGRFIISLPVSTGVQELFVTPDPSIQSPVEVRIDQDFDAVDFSIPEEKFILSAQERDVATRIALHTQLSTAYDPRQEKVGSPPDSTAEDTISFYGTPLRALILDDYIELPTMEEVFINLIPEIQIEVRRGLSTIRIYRPNSAVEMFQPLIMVDHIPVFDQQAVLGIAPEKIQKVDVINAVYVKGTIYHGGLINIISRKGDMAGIDLPDDSYFFDFKSINPYEPEKYPTHSPADRVPDTRNTLFWLDDVLLEKDSIHDFSFRAPSQPGEYVILVRGMVGPGELLSATARFTVE